MLNFKFFSKDKQGAQHASNADFADQLNKSLLSSDTGRQIDIQATRRMNRILRSEGLDTAYYRNMDFLKTLVGEGYLPLNDKITTETLEKLIHNLKDKLEKGEHIKGGEDRARGTLAMMEAELEKRDVINYDSTEEAANSSSFPQEETTTDKNIFITLSEKAENIETLSDEELTTLIQEVTTALKSPQGEQDQELRTSLKGLFSTLTDKKYSLEHYSVKKDSQIKTD